MKKDGKELISIWYYHIVGYDRKKIVYRTKEDSNGECEYYIKTKDNGYVRVYRYSGAYSLQSVKETVVSALPDKIQKQVEELRDWFTRIDKNDYNCESDYMREYQFVYGNIEGFCIALRLAGVIESKWDLEKYMYGYAD